jgi:uncharacterized protein YqgC (DUF456 family)
MSVADIIITVITGIVMLIGLLGVLLPIFPDMIVMIGAALGYGLLVGWGETGVWFFGAIAFLGLAGIAADIWVSGMGGRIGGASYKSILVGIVLGMIGFIFLTPLGGLAILLLATFLMEYVRQGDAEKAIKGMLGIGIGYGASFVVKLLIGLVMMVLWVLWVIFR